MPCRNPETNCHHRYNGECLADRIERCEEITPITEGDTLTYRGNEYTVDWISLDDDGNPHIIGVSGPWECYAGTVKELKEMGFERK